MTRDVITIAEEASDKAIAAASHCRDLTCRVLVELIDQPKIMADTEAYYQSRSRIIDLSLNLIADNIHGAAVCFEALKAWREVARFSSREYIEDALVNARAMLGSIQNIAVNVAAFSARIYVLHAEYVLAPHLVGEHMQMRIGEVMVIVRDAESAMHDIERLTTN